MDVKWAIQGRQFINCNCAYGCPCQFNAAPTHGFCEAVEGFQIDKGFHGETRLDGLRFVSIFHWPGPIHDGNGEGAFVVDVRATPKQRELLLRIMSGEDTEPGATVFQVFSTTLKKVHDPIFAPIDFEVDVEQRKARLVVSGITEGRGEPIVNPVTGQTHRARIDLPHGFEFSLAEIGRGWTTATSPIRMNLTDSHGQFANIHLNQNGVVR